MNKTNTTTENVKEMSLRDYFAAKAVSQLIARDTLIMIDELKKDAEDEGDNTSPFFYYCHEGYGGVARDAYALADAMMEQRLKKTI
jgi:hypothetical protein